MKKMMLGNVAVCGMLATFSPWFLIPCGMALVFLTIMVTVDVADPV